MPNFISEDDIEQAMVQRLQHLYGYDALMCFTNDPADLDDGSGRMDKREVILYDRLREAMVALNPDIPETAIEDALKILRDKRQALSAVAANRELDGLIRDGVRVEFKDAKGRSRKERVRIIDFNEPDANQFLAATQLWIQSTGIASKAGYRRPDILLYVNGLPLVFIELKNSNVKLKTAYDDNLTNYKADIPQLFLTNALCVLSNAIETRVGSPTAQWEHFFRWLRPDDEKEKIRREQIASEGTSAERFLAGLCAKDKLLDYLENFILYYKNGQKIVAQNHQFLGVNRAFGVFVERRRMLTGEGVLAVPPKESLTPGPSPKGRGEKWAAPYRCGYDFSGLVKRARELRRDQTPAEETLWELLRNRRFVGLKFRRQHQIGDFIVDFFCDEHKCAVELDGAVHSTVEKRRHDANREAILQGQGFGIIRIPNEMVLNHPHKALTNIASNLPSPPGRGAGGEGNTPGPRGGLGVFWHTQGSGKIFRKCQGNYSVVVITDRDDLDGQIYRNFLDTGTVRKADAAQPRNSE